MRPLDRLVVEAVGPLLFLLIILALCARLYHHYASVGITSDSMAPTLMAGDKVIVDKMAYLKSPPKRGDIVVFEDPRGGGELLTKRVIGLPGEWVLILKGTVFINGRPLSEPYVKHNIRERPQAWFVPKGYVFVLGDNRACSEDSRDFGPIEIRRIRGKVVWRYAPLSRWGKVE